jgi:ankyrin repeat protein
MTVSAEDFLMSNPHAGGTIYIWTLGGNKSAHAVAHDFGHENVFRLLIDRSPHDLAVAAACEIGDEDLVRALIRAQAIDPARLDDRLLRRGVDAADRNEAKAVGLMLSSGWPVDARGKHGATALHFAAWHGNADLVREILARRPSLETRDRDFNMTPLGWAFHGSLHGSNRQRGDYAATAEALLAAGAAVPTIEPTADQASEAVRDVLRRRKGQNGG